MPSPPRSVIAIFKICGEYGLEDLFSNSEPCRESDAGGGQETRTKSKTDI